MAKSVRKFLADLLGEFMAFNEQKNRSAGIPVERAVRNYTQVPPVPSSIKAENAEFGEVVTLDQISSVNTVFACEKANLEAKILKLLNAFEQKHSVQLAHTSSERLEIQTIGQTVPEHRPLTVFKLTFSC